jgi:hypothetical protein
MPGCCYGQSCPRRRGIWDDPNGAVWGHPILDDGHPLLQLAGGLAPSQQMCGVWPGVLEVTPQFY